MVSGPMIHSFAHLHSAPVFTLRIQSRQPYLIVAATGPAGLGELSGLAAFVAEVVKSERHGRVLADLSRVTPNLSFTDHLRFGALVWELLGGLERVAAVVPHGYLDAPAARAAKLAGMPLKTFLRMEEAQSWMAATQEPLRLAGGLQPERPAQL